MTVSEEYNSLPLKVREVCSQVMLISQINELERSKERAIRHHRAFIKEVNDHINNCKRGLIRKD